MRVPVEFSVNGTPVSLSVPGDETLLHTLRARLGLIGTKEGCVEGECGACTVLVDGVPLDSCIRLTAAVDGSEVLTVEGLGSEAALSPLQQAFIDHGAVQCGFCTPGFLMTLTALLGEKADPSEGDVQHALAGNLCRCTGYQQILEAVATVSEEAP